MKYTISSINNFLFFKLPSVWWCGIRVKEISSKSCRANVRLGWFNKNPFKSLFWAVQGMAAELTTGMLIMQAITSSKKNSPPLSCKVRICCVVIFFFRFFNSIVFLQ